MQVKSLAAEYRSARWCTMCHGIHIAVKAVPVEKHNRDRKTQMWFADATFYRRQIKRTPERNNDVLLANSIWIGYLER